MDLATATPIYRSGCEGKLARWAVARNSRRVLHFRDFDLAGVHVERRSGCLGTAWVGRPDPNAPVTQKERHVMAIVTMQDLLQAGIHFGHQTRRWNPRMAKYIFGQRNGIYIIDLQQTLRQVHAAYKVVRDTAAGGGTVLFVGTKKQAREPIAREATRANMYYINNRWLGGTLTNFATLKQSVRNMVKLQELESSGKINALSKKEASQLRRKRFKLEKNLAGIQEMDVLPSVVFIIDAKRETIAIREAKRCGIPCIAVVDTNANPDEVPLPIPGNDDAIRAVNLFCKLMADAALEGQGIAEKSQAEERARKGVAATSAAGNGEEASAAAKTEGTAPAAVAAPAAPVAPVAPVAVPVG